MATHSGILAWKVPWTEEPGGLQSKESQSRAHLSEHTAFYKGSENQCLSLACFHPKVKANHSFTHWRFS